MKRMKTALGIGSLTVIFLTSVHAQSVILGWDFTGQESVLVSESDLVITGLASSTLTRGPEASASSGMNSFRTQGFGNDGIALSNTDYFEFTIDPANGQQVSVSNINAAFNGTATFSASPGGVTMAYAYSLNGGSFTLLPTFIKIGTSAAPMSFDLSSYSDLQNTSATITMRFFASGQTNTGGWGFYSSSSGVHGLSVNGTVSAVPEPSTYAAAAGSIALLGAMWLRRRRCK